jgi:hypothetical protein
MERQMMSESLGGKSADRVVIVPAASALDEYLNHSVYICLPHRFFQPSVRMAFYTNNKIDRHIPRILSQIEAISPDEIESKADLSESQRAKLRTLLKNLEAKRFEEWRKLRFEIIFLTPKDSPETLVLPSDIENDHILAITSLEMGEIRSL